MDAARGRNQVRSSVNETVLITGAAGKIGTILRQRMRRPDRSLRLLDRERPADESGPCLDSEEWIVGDVTDPEVVRQACRGVDAVVHLGGLSREHEPGALLEINVGGTFRLLEAARDAHVPRVVIASSNHVLGMAPLVDVSASEGLRPLIDTAAPVRPDTMYGVTKVAQEATARLFAERFDMDVICLRIGACVERPSELRHLVFWLSPADASRLVEAALDVPDAGFAVVWGVSRNTRGVLSLSEGRAIGYEPRDDAEKYAGELHASDAQRWRSSHLDRIGGRWAVDPVGVYNPPGGRA